MMIEQAETERDIYLAAVDKWGVAAQAIMAMEECGELVAAISRFFFREKSEAYSKSTLVRLASEIADVEIMCGQLRVIVGDERINTEKSARLNRLKTRLEVTDHG